MLNEPEQQLGEFPGVEINTPFVFVDKLITLVSVDIGGTCRKAAECLPSLVDWTFQGVRALTISSEFRRGLGQLYTQFGFKSTGQSATGHPTLLVTLDKKYKGKIAVFGK